MTGHSVQRVVLMMERMRPMAEAACKCRFNAAENMNIYKLTWHKGQGCLRCCQEKHVQTVWTAECSGFEARPPPRVQRRGGGGGG